MNIIKSYKYIVEVVIKKYDNRAEMQLDEDVMEFRGWKQLRKELKLKGETEEEDQYEIEFSKQTWQTCADVL